MVCLASESFHSYHFGGNKSHSEGEYILVEDFSHGHLHTYYVHESKKSGSDQIERGASNGQNDFPSDKPKDVSEHHLHLASIISGQSQEIQDGSLAITSLIAFDLVNQKPSSYTLNVFRPPIS